MSRSATDLPVRSNVAVFPSREGESLVWESLLNTSARVDTWRIIELISSSKIPFEAKVAWSAGTGTGSHAQISVARATRLCVFARALHIEAANLGSQKNKVQVTVADGHCSSRNQHAVSGTISSKVTPIAIPPFAAHCHVEANDWRRLRQVDVRLRDGLGQVVGSWNGHRQPPAGILLGGAGSLELIAPLKMFYRVVFVLTL